jgi:acetylglutamate kinase
VSTLTKRDAERLIKAGVIDGGMLPKVESSLRALAGGAQKAHIIDGRVPHAILLEVLTVEGIGTEIIL